MVIPQNKKSGLGFVNGKGGGSDLSGGAEIILGLELTVFGKNKNIIVGIGKAYELSVWSGRQRKGGGGLFSSVG